MAKTVGKRNLALIRKSGSTARIMNLLAPLERHGDTPDYNAKPLFRSRRTNRAILIKHTLRGSELDQFDDRRTTGTKVVFPFALSDLALGGAFLFVGERNCDQTYAELIGNEVSQDDLRADLRVLANLDKLPSLDPFLVRESLRRERIEPARCYFDIGEADIQRMTDYVSNEIAVLVRLAFSGAGEGSVALSQMLAQKLLSDENTESLLPLRATLQLSGEEYSEGIFAWKGFLYYKWQFADQQTTILKAVRDISRLKFARADVQTTNHLNLARDRILKQCAALESFVKGALTTYDKSFRDLTVKARPMAFREFLLNSPAMFLDIGHKLGALLHVAAFWRFQFPEDSLLRMEADDAVDLLQEFENCLGTGGPAARSQVKW
jgi:hypothetical protein